MAYELLLRVDPTAKDRLIPTMLNDPSVELRHDAVARLIREAQALADTDQAADVPGVYEMALSAARDPNQVKLIAGRLKDLGKQVDLARHFGFIQRWKVIAKNRTSHLASQQRSSRQRGTDEFPRNHRTILTDLATRVDVNVE